MTRLDFSQPPFDVLNPVERQSLKKHTQVRYLAKDERLPPDELDFFYVVLKGHIQQLLGCEYVGDFVASEFSNDWFDARRMVNDGDAFVQNHDPNKAMIGSPRSSNLAYCYLATEDSLLLQIEAAAIDRLSAQNHHIRQLLSGELSERMQALNHRRDGRQPSWYPMPSVLSAPSHQSLEQVTNQSLRQPNTQSTSQHSQHSHRYRPEQIDQHSNPQTSQSQTSQSIETQQLMLQPVTTIPLLPVHLIDEAASLLAAAKTMTQAGLKHVLIQRAPSPERHPTKDQDSSIGILTDADICRAVSESVDMAATPCSKYAKFRLRTIADHQDISDALLTMIRYKVHRLPVIGSHEEVIGVLGQSDLLAFLNQHSQLITVQIEQAEDVERLQIAVEQIGQYIRAQQQNGVKIGVISRMVQTLNAQVFTKLWRLIVPEMVFENTCVIVMGSEGRGEQIMRTDQDNALIIRNGFNHPDLADFAERFNQTLDQMGYPLCDGNIMMTNPLWRQPLNRFKSQVSGWFNSSETEAAIWLSALIDGAYVCGDERLLESLREHLQIAHKNADPMFVRGFAKAALQFGDVNQWWQKFAPLIGKPMPQDIDLKKAGIFPLVHGIRALALEKDILAVTSTKARLSALVQAGVFTQSRAATLNEALEFFMSLRLAVALSTEDKFARQVDPNTLSALERDLLKECLNVVKSFKNELRQHYQLEMA